MPECHVLLVDDEEDFVVVLAERLETRNLQVDTAGDDHPISLQGCPDLKRR